MSELGTTPAEALEIVQRIPPAQGKSMKGIPFERRDTVRVGFIGVGGRGHGLLGEMLAVEGAVVTAVSDAIPEHAQRAKKRVEDAGRPSPAVEADWRKLCRRDDVDLVYIASRWDDHVPQAVYAMDQGKHAAVEVPAATTLAGCWALVDASEKNRRHCVQLENCCYGHTEMLVLNLIQAGMLGTLTHGEAAYIHDLRDFLLADYSEGLWRREPHKTRNGNLYPTHGLGPLCRYLGIHQGDRMARLVSLSSLSASLEEYRDSHVPEDSPKRQETYLCGDMNSSLIRTAQGRTILLQHDVVTPRPYSRLNLIQGTKGTFADFPPRLFLDGQEGGHDWQPIEKFKDEWEAPLWKVQGELARKLGGHGGMDFLMNYRLIQCFREGLPPEIDAYDAAAWSAPGPLSEISVAHDGLALPFPDFTRGSWR